MSIALWCDFCGERVENTHPRDNVLVRDENGMAVAGYDACNTCVSLITVMLEDRRGVLRPGPESDR